mmetsp:Transcript_658/g.809  ORF Transcript_658/g.809 Transcript_658/m.809 type:complete len:262 (-) Transcript_658:1233-2018(-)
MLCQPYQTRARWKLVIDGFSREVHKGICGCETEGNFIDLDGGWVGNEVDTSIGGILGYFSITCSFNLVQAKCAVGCILCIGEKLHDLSTVGDSIFQWWLRVYWFGNGIVQTRHNHKLSLQIRLILKQTLQLHGNLDHKKLLITHMSLDPILILHCQMFPIILLDQFLPHIQKRSHQQNHIRLGIHDHLEQIREWLVGEIAISGVGTCRGEDGDGFAILTICFLGILHPCQFCFGSFDRLQSYRYIIIIIIHILLFIIFWHW